MTNDYEDSFSGFQVVCISLSWKYLKMSSRLHSMPVSEVQQEGFKALKNAEDKP